MVTPAFDADVVIYAATGDERGLLVHEAIGRPTGVAPIGIGSTLLLTETLTLPLKHAQERQRVTEILSRLTLLPVTQDIAVMAATLRVRHRLKTPDALHLATAIVGGADQFVTNNHRDFGSQITEIDIVYP